MLTIKIEIRTAHLTAEKDQVMVKLVRILAKQILAQASLMQDLSPPEIKITAGDFFSSTDEIKLFDADGNEYDTDVVSAIDRLVINAPKREEEAE